MIEKIRRLDPDWTAAILAVVIGTSVTAWRVHSVMEDPKYDDYPYTAPTCVDPDLDPYDPIELREIQEQIKNCITK